MPDRIATITLKNMETGELIDFGEFYFYPTGFAMTTIVMVKDIESYRSYPNGTITVVMCKALDSAGMVFDIDVEFIKNTPEEKAVLLSDITTNSVYIFHGQYEVESNGSIVMKTPEYRAVEPDFKEDEVREAFRINEAHIINEALILKERHRKVCDH